MIELMLQAERALMVGMVDQAERLYQMAARNDPRNAIAVVGLARVALERNDDRGAYDLSRQALAIDPENAAALRLEARLSEVLTHRGETVERPAFITAGERTTDAFGARDVSPATAEPFPPAPRMSGGNGTNGGIGAAMGADPSRSGQLTSASAQPPSQPPQSSRGPGLPWMPPGWATDSDVATASAVSPPSAVPPASAVSPASAVPPASAAGPLASGAGPLESAAGPPAGDEPKPFRIWPPPGQQASARRPAPSIQPGAMGRPDVDLTDPSTWPARPVDPALNAAMSDEARSAMPVGQDWGNLSTTAWPTTSAPAPGAAGDTTGERTLRGGVPESAAVAAPWATAAGAVPGSGQPQPALTEPPRRPGLLRRLFGR